MPGRGEHPGVYERFGRRIAAAGYRVRVVADPTAHEARVTRQVVALLADDPAGEGGPRAAGAGEWLRPEAETTAIAGAEALR